MPSLPPTIFVVDDDPAVLKGLSRLLRAARLDVVTFNSPQEFLERTDPRTPDCLVLDVAMPGMSGLELQAALITKGSTVPIIFLTGNGDTAMSLLAMKRGAVAFLTKPVNDDDLLKAVRLALEKDQTRN